MKGQKEMLVRQDFLETQESRVRRVSKANLADLEMTERKEIQGHLGILGQGESLV